MFFSFRNTINISKLNNKYKNKKFLNKKDFHNLNPIILTNSLKINKQRFANYSKPIAGTVIESGFFSKKYVYLSNKIFRNSTINFPYNKINKYVNYNKFLNDFWRARVYFRLSETKSFICFAGSGSGKTTGIVLPTIMANALSPTQPNLLITDPKGELSKSSFVFLQNQGYKVKVINLLDEKNSDCFSPFTLIKEMIWKMIEYPLNCTDLSISVINKKLEIVNDLDTELKNIIYSLNDKPGISSEKFWDQKAAIAIHNIAWLLIDDLCIKYKKWESKKINNPKDNRFFLNKNLSKTDKLSYFNELFVKFSFQSIYETLAAFGVSGSNKYKEFYKNKFKISIDDLSPQFIKEHKGLQQWKNLWRNQDSKSNFSEDIISNALNILEKFNVPSLHNITTFNTFSLDDLYGNKEKPFALFITINNSEVASLSYVSWFINYLLMKLNSFATKDGKTKLKKPLMCIFEEIGNVPYIQFLPVTVNEGRGKNIFVSLFFQTYAQYRNKYAHDGDFMRSCAYRVLLTNSEGHFVKELVEYAGFYEWFDKTNNKMVKEKRLTENDIYSLPKFQAIVLQNDINIPYYANLIPYHLFGYEMLSRLNIKINDPTFHKRRHIVYNPLAKADEFDIDDAIAIDFDFVNHPQYKLTIAKKAKLVDAINKTINLVERQADKDYWKSLLDKLEKCIPIEQKLSPEQLNEIEANKKGSIDLVSKDVKSEDLENEIYSAQMLALIFNSKNNSYDFQRIIQTLLSKENFFLFSDLNNNWESKLHRFFKMDKIQNLLSLFKVQDLNELKTNLINSENQIENHLIIAYLKLIEFVVLKEAYYNQFKQQITVELFKKIKTYYLLFNCLSQAFIKNELNPTFQNQYNKFDDLLLQIDYSLLIFLIYQQDFNTLFKWNQKSFKNLKNILSNLEQKEQLSTLIDVKLFQFLTQLIK